MLTSKVVSKFLFPPESDGAFPHGEFGLLAFMADAFVILFASFAFAQQLLYFAGLSFQASWILGEILTMIGIFWLWSTAGQLKTNAFHLPRRTDWPLWLGILVAAGLALFLHRPDADDQYYLGLAVLALDNETVPMQSMQNLNVGYVLTSYDFLRAAFSSIFNVPILISYYLIWPTIIAALVVIFQWRLLKLLAVENMALALIIFFVVMIGWGDVHRTPANFGFVRFFQGKGGLIWLAIPSAIYYWLKFVAHSEQRFLALLFCSIVAGIGFSPTGAPLGALLVGVFIIATLSYRDFHSNREVLIGLSLVIIYPLVIGLLMRFYFGYVSLGVHTEKGVVASISTWEMIKFVLGDNGRGITALLCSALLPWTLRKSSVNPLLARYSILCTLLLAFPWTSQLLGHYAFMTMSWRWLYVVPFTLAIVVTADKIICLTTRPIGRMFITIFTGAFFLALSPRWVISEANYTQIKMISPKLENPEEVFLSPYDKTARIENLRLISPATGNRL